MWGIVEGKPTLTSNSIASNAACMVEFEKLARELGAPILKTERGYIFAASGTIFVLYLAV